MRAALLEASEKPLTIVDDIDIEDPRAGDELFKWIYSGGVILNGLITRRNREHELFYHDQVS